MLIVAATPRQKGPWRTSQVLAVSLDQHCIKLFWPSSPFLLLPMQVSEWDKKKEEDIKGRMRFPESGMRLNPELTVFRRGTGLYRKTRTWSHCSPEEISKRNAFILVHDPSQVKQHNHMFLKETVLSRSTNLFKVQTLYFLVQKQSDS